MKKSPNPGRLQGACGALRHVGAASLTSFFTSFPLALALLLLAEAGELVWGARASAGRAGARGGASAAPDPASFPFFF